MFAQDTGSAIVGPARADIYFGAGDEAARMAGRIKNPGDFVMLLPRAARSGRGGPWLPLPPERPSPSEIAQFSADAAADPTAEDNAAGR